MSSDTSCTEREQASHTSSSSFQNTNNTLSPSMNQQQDQQQQQQQYTLRSRRLEHQTPERRWTRVQWQLLMWLPFFLLLLHRQREISEVTNNIVTVSNIVIIIAIFAPLGAYNEYQDGFRFPTYIIALAVGFVWGAVRMSLKDVVAARFIAMIVFGFSCSKLRFNWDVKRVASRFAKNTPSIWLTAWNYNERVIGLAPWFLVGECSSAFAQEGGVAQLIDGTWGTLLFLSSPIVSTQVGQYVSTFVSAFVSKCFSSWTGTREHHANASRRQTIMFVVTIVFSVALLFGIVGYFLATYIPFVWQHDQLAGAVGVIIEQVTLSQQRDEAKAVKKQRKQEMLMNQNRK